MILVTGTKRSGTSLWMQALGAAGFPVLGEAFPSVWERSIRDANPRGFYESPLRQGVFYATNPDPKTGAYLRPANVRRHAVKVFVPGVVRTNLAYIDHVVGTMRRWRDHARSLEGLFGLEDHWHERERGPDAVARVRQQRGTVPAAAEWFRENYDLVRDFSVRRYRINLTTYERLISEPESVLTQVIGWLGGGDVQAAVRTVDPALHRVRDAVVDEPPYAPILDAFYDEIHRTGQLSRDLAAELNALDRQLAAEFGRPDRDRGRDAGDRGD